MCVCVYFVLCEMNLARKEKKKEKNPKTLNVTIVKCENQICFSITYYKTNMFNINIFIPMSILIPWVREMMK